MDFFSKNLPYLLAGVSVGGQYALIAIGYTMVYGILRLINFAHGDIFMVAGLVMVYASTVLPLYVSIPLTIIVTIMIFRHHENIGRIKAGNERKVHWMDRKNKVEN